MNPLASPARPARFRPLADTLALAALAVLAGCGGEPPAPATAMATEPIEVEGLDEPQRLLALAQGVTRGDPDAPVTILEFADFSCPHCKVFDEQVVPRIDFTWLQDGRAKMVFHDYPLGGFPHSFLAARAARCAGDQQRYWEYHGLLFGNQASWSTSRSVPVDSFLEYAGSLGLDRAAFESCLRSDRHADVVSANRRLARELQLGGTPAVLIGRQGDPIPRRVDDPSWESIAQAVEAILAGG